MNKRYSNCKLHPKQIPTKKYIIESELSTIGFDAATALLDCLLSESNGNEQKNNIIAAAFLLEFVSRLIYRNKNGAYCKLPVEKYYQNIFEGYAEDPDEVFSRAEESGYKITHEKAEHIHKLVWQIADIVCPMIVCTDEQAFVSEYAYAIEYVIRHDGNLQKPEMQGLFPKNYADYRYEEGIAEEMRKAIDFYL